MKPETLHTLIIARTLMDKAHELCFVDDRYVASAGLVILQDGLELVLYACLIERGIDEKKSIEDFSFNQLIGELQSQTKLIKTGTLKALNKERVIVKHYGHVAEPTTVRNFFKVASEAIDALLREVLGMGFHQVMLHELLKESEAKGYVQAAINALEECKYYEALKQTRMAIFVEIEQEYSIDGWKDYTEETKGGLLAALDRLKRGGLKAPWYTRNKDWIAENVTDPFEYIQRDDEKLRLDLMELGVPTNDYWNISKLTPKVFRRRSSKDWCVKTEPDFFDMAATKENARYCIDRTISILLKKQEHSDRQRILDGAQGRRLRVKFTRQEQIFSKASIHSKPVGALEAGKTYRADSFTPGLEAGEFIYIVHVEDEPNLFLYGYARAECCEVEDVV
jgi:hypothetical protein